MIVAVRGVTEVVEAAKGRKSDAILLFADPAGVALSSLESLARQGFPTPCIASVRHLPFPNEEKSRVSCGSPKRRD